MIRIASLIACSLFGALPALADASSAAPTGGASAIGYIQSGSAIPDDADYSRGDVPRDDYGRPWTYEGLGAPLPAFIAETSTGQSFGSQQLKDRWTVLQVWGIWCHDSMNDAPYAASLSTALAQEPSVDFLTIHTPHTARNAARATKSYESVAAWFDEKGYTYPTLVDHDASLRNHLKIRWTPTYLVIAPDLTVQAFRTGLADAGDDAVAQFVENVKSTQATWQAAQNQ